MVDLPPDVSSEPQEFAVDPVQHRLEEVSLPGILAVKQLQDVQHEGLVDVPLGKGWLQVGRLQEPQEEGVHQLENNYEE